MRLGLTLRKLKSTQEPDSPHGQRNQLEGSPEAVLARLGNGFRSEAGTGVRGPTELPKAIPERDRQTDAAMKAGSPSMASLLEALTGGKGWPGRADANVQT